MKKKILVVDDHPTMLTFMADILEKEGHEVVTAEDGFSALNIISSFIPDIIFVDLVMPKISGDKLCQIFRKMPDLNDCQLVVVSGAIAEQEFDYTVIGADASIAKGPFEVMTDGPGGWAPDDPRTVILKSSLRNHAGEYGGRDPGSLFR
ncbi:MAG: response regulator [Deltaproteobacteria bacterium]|nr:response regulator [Deltaproteobacteria bacterium]